MKLMQVLQSRKFWSSLLGIAISIGLYTGDAIMADQLVDAIMVIVSTFVMATGIESGLEQMNSNE